MTFLRRFLVSLLGCFVVVLLIFGTVNPFGWFWGRHFLTTTPVTRARKQVLLDAWNRKAPVEGLVFGSSQSMKLDPALLTQLTGRRFFNFAVSSGRIEDAYALLDYVGERHLPIKQVLMGVDPWMFGPGDLSPELTDDWQLSARVNDRRPTLPWKIGHGARLVANALTLSYARQVIISIQATRAGREPLHSFFDNGYLEYRDPDRRRAAGTYKLDPQIRQCIGEVMENTVTAHIVDSTRFNLFARTLDRARAMGIAVTVWIPPRHPRLYAVLDTVPTYRSWRAHAADSIRSVAEAHGARFVNLSTIDRFGGDTLDWYDCVHYGAANARLVTARLTER
ncbi:MAG: hypothetical protein ABI661_06840 [Gammaproteobacteria bacterium]